MKLWADIRIKGNKAGKENFRSQDHLDDFIGQQYSGYVAWESLDYDEDRECYEVWGLDDMIGYVILEYKEVF